jgi:hypothetical protein
MWYFRKYGLHTPPPPPELGGASNTNINLVLKPIEVATANRDSLWIAEDDLAIITTAARARQARQRSNLKVVQKGGVFIVKGARATTDARVEQDAAKVGRAATRKFKKDSYKAVMK